MSTLVAENNSGKTNTTEPPNKDAAKEQLKTRLNAICEELSQKLGIEIVPNIYTRKVGTIFPTVCLAEVCDEKPKKNRGVGELNKRFVALINTEYINSSDVSDNEKISIESVRESIIAQCTDFSKLHPEIESSRIYFKHENSFQRFSKSLLYKLANLGWSMVDINLPDDKDKKQAHTSKKHDVIVKTAEELFERLSELPKGTDKVINFVEIGCWNANGIEEVLRSILDLNNSASKDKKREDILKNLNITFLDISEAAIKTAKEAMKALPDDLKNKLNMDNLAYRKVNSIGEYPKDIKADIVRAVNVFDAIPTDLYVYLGENEKIGKLKVKTYFDKELFAQLYNKESSKTEYPLLKQFEINNLSNAIEESIIQFSSESAYFLKFYQKIFGERKDLGEHLESIARKIHALALGKTTTEEFLESEQKLDEKKFIKSFCRKIYDLPHSIDPTTEQLSTGYKIWITAMGSLKLDARVVTKDISNDRVLTSINEQATNNNLAKGTILPISKRSSALISNILNIMQDGACSIFPNLNREMRHAMDKYSLPMILGATPAFFTIHECFIALANRKAEDIRCSLESNLFSITGDPLCLITMFTKKDRQQK